MKSITFAQYNQIIRGGPAIGNPAFSLLPYLTPDIMEGDLVTVNANSGGYSPGAASGSPSPTLSSVQVLLNALSQGVSYQTVIGQDAGKTMQCVQTAINSNRSVIARSATVTIRPRVYFGNNDASAPGYIGGNVRDVQYSNAVHSSRGFGIQGTFAGPAVGSGAITFSTTSQGAGVTVISTAASFTSGNGGTIKSDVGKHIILPGNIDAAVITAIVSTNQVTVTLLYPIATVGPYPVFVLGCPLDSNGWPTIPSELVMTAGATGVSDGNLKSGVTYTLTYKSAGRAGVISSTLGSSGLTISSIDNTNPDGVTSKYTFSTTLGGVALFMFSTPVTDVDCPNDGSASSVSQPLFTPACMAYYSQFGSLRFLDFLYTNAPRTDTTWDTRPFDYAKCQAGLIPSWERFITVVNAVAAYPGSKLRKIWINIPPFVNPEDYASGFANFLNISGLNPLVSVDFIEYSNEVWNPGYPSVFHGFEHIGMDEAQGLANYELLYPTWTVTSVTADGVRQLATVTLNTSVVSYPYIVNGAPIVVYHVNAPTWSAPLNTPNVASTVPITLVDDGLVSGTVVFTYPTQTVLPASTAAQGWQCFFNLSSNLLTDNLGFQVAQIKQKYMVRQLHRMAAVWSAIRPQDKFVVGMQEAGFRTGNNTNSKLPIELLYAKYIGGGSTAWLSSATIANYVTSTGQTTADGVFSTAVGALYQATEQTGIQGLDNSCRAFVYACQQFGLRPVCYEGGPDLQFSASAQIASQLDPRMGQLVTDIMRTWFANGGQDWHFFHLSPRPFSNNSQGGWTAIQTYQDTPTPGPNYSPKLAALLAFTSTAVRNFANRNGSPGTATTLHYQNGILLSGLVGSVVNPSSGMIYWFGNTVARNFDVQFTFPRTRRWNAAIWGSDHAGTSTVATLQMTDGAGGWVTLGTTVLGAGGDGYNNAAVPSASAPILTPDIPAGSHAFRVLFGAGVGTSPGVKQIVFSEA